MTSVRRPLPPPDERHLASARLLVDLVANPLDAGYAEAARRKAGKPAHRSAFDRPAVAIGCVLIGFLLVVAYVHTNRRAPATKRAHDALVTRVRAAQDATDKLAKQLTDAQAQLVALQAHALPAGGLARALTLDRLAAGQVAASGPGLVVTLSEPPAVTPTAGTGRGGSTPITQTSILTDRDVRSVVNELWLDGAEAMSVNDVRLTPTSAIRFAGEAVLVDFAPITSPYTIRAIGNADTLSTSFAQSAAASRYQTLASADGIGFQFTDSQHLTVPAAAPVTLRYAHAAPRGRR